MARGDNVEAFLAAIQAQADAALAEANAAAGEGKEGGMSD